jgi:hypothetical protein
MAGPAPLVQLHPNMSYEQLIMALEQNMALLQNQGKTWIINDETGTARIIIGRQPDGSYGMVISKPGINVVSLYS